MSEFISDKITVISELSPDEVTINDTDISKYGLSLYVGQNAPPEAFKIRNIKYKLRYKNGPNIKIDVPFGNLLHIVNSFRSDNEWYYYLSLIHI